MIPRAWPGETCYIIGGGPSLIGFDFDRLRGKPTIVINRMFRLCPFANVLYFCDSTWWCMDGVEALATFTGQWIITTARINRLPAAYQSVRIQRIENTGRLGLEPSPHGVKHGTNSGYQAINVAYHFGVSRIVLLGFDMDTGGAIDRNGPTHAHGGYGRDAHEVQHVLKERMLPHFDYLAKPLADAGVEVINASPKSGIDIWPKVSLADVPI